MKYISFILSLIMAFFGSLAGDTVNTFRHPLEVKTVISQKSPLNVRNGETSLQDTVEYAYEMQIRKEISTVFQTATPFLLTDLKTSIRQPLKTRKVISILPTRSKLSIRKRTVCAIISRTNYQ